VQIITRSAGILGVAADAAGVAEIARRSHLSRQSTAEARARLRAGARRRQITSAVAAEALKRLDVDEFGLDDMDADSQGDHRDVRGRAGRRADVAAAVGEDPGTLEEVYEPF
jgi:Holliday junction DNA helicase RuvB